MSQPSIACCTIPPVISKGYEPKGSYGTIDDLKTYITGPDTAKKAILVVYDIFGFFPQTVQGADILASTEEQYKVFIPDFLDGEVANIKSYPPKNDEQKKTLDAFFAGVAAPLKTVARIATVVKDFKDKNPNIESIGIVGFCWGGKVATLVCGADSAFKAGAKAHPAMVDPSDAEKVTIPFCVLASKDEDAEAISGFDKNLKVPKHVETFSDQIHGWMAARGNLEDERNKAEYERGYKILLKFFKNNL